MSRAFVPIYLVLINMRWIRLVLHMQPWRPVKCMRSMLVIRDQLNGPRLLLALSSMTMIVRMICRLVWPPHMMVSLLSFVFCRVHTHANINVFSLLDIEFISKSSCRVCFLYSLVCIVLKKVRPEQWMCGQIRI